MQTAVPAKRSLWERLSQSNWIGLVPFFSFILFFLFLPSTNLLFKSFQDINGNFTLSNYAVMQNPYVIKAYRVSLQVSIITSLVGGVFGFFVAYAITIGNTPRWMRNFLMTFSGLAANFGGVPLAFSYIATLGRTGFVTAILKSICYPDAAGLQVCPFNPYDNGFNLYSLSGLVLAYTYFQFPLMVLTITPALEGLKKEWREASENLGASPWQYWRDVALPILLPSILGATLLLFGSAFGAYATAYALTGGSIYLITILISQQIRGDVLNNPYEGYALAVGMIVIMGLTILAYTTLQRRTSRWLKS
ncbi:MAG: ABC transporter permease subunit [Anaerolineales bacterium]|nr:ABC transporter permease subunit [Anaerolineales bacterium]